MPVVDVPVPGWKTLRVQTEQGYSYLDTFVQRRLPTKDLKLQFQCMKEMDVREDDVIICAYVKAGTHWLWEVISMLSKEHSSYQPLIKEAAMLEFITKETAAGLPSPRVLNTHHTPVMLPHGFTDRKCKIIHVMRNPKDICVSYYYHQLAMGHVGTAENYTFSQHLLSFISEESLLRPCSYFWFVKEFKKFKRENPDYPIMFMFYEDMKMQPEQEIKKLAAFLGKNTTDDLITEIAERCSFDQLKTASIELKDDPRHIFKREKKAAMFRKGQIGDWKNHFTVAENELFDKWIDDQSKDTDIRFRYE